MEYKKGKNLKHSKQELERSFDERHLYSQDLKEYEKLPEHYNSAGFTTMIPIVPLMEVGRHPFFIDAIKLTSKFGDHPIDQDKSIINDNILISGPSENSTKNKYLNH